MSVNDVQYATALREQYVELASHHNAQDSEYTAHVLTPRDNDGIRDAALVLGEAFEHGDPVFSHLREVGQRHKPLNRFFEYVVRESLMRGGSPVVAYRDDETPVAASLYELPGMRPESTVYTYLHGAPPTIRAFGLSGALRAGSAVAEVDQKMNEIKADLKKPVLYLAYIGVRPDFRGTGAIHAVADPALKLADKFDLFATLVSSNRQQNHDAFTKAGYREVSTTHYDGGTGPVLGNMVRRPKQSGANLV